MNMLNLSHKPLGQLESAPLLVTPPRPRLSAASPAFEVLTDFSRLSPRTISPDVGIDEALLMMRLVGIRFRGATLRCQGQGVARHDMLTRSLSRPEAASPRRAGRRRGPPPG